MLYDLLKQDLQQKYILEGRELPAKINILCIFKNMFGLRFMPVVLFRISFALQNKRYGTIAKIFSLINFVFFGIEITNQCVIDGGLFFPHTVGTVIGAGKIGKNAIIYQGVTLGAKCINIPFDKESRPVIGDNVIIGSGAKVLGGITIGNDVVIGANAVVVKSIPNNVIATGVPAKIIAKTKNVENC